jgi:L-lactate dehydrogenase complex protein LldG
MSKPAERFDTLETSLAAVDAKLHFVKDDKKAAAAILAIIKETNVKKLAYTAESILADLKLPEALAEAGYDLIAPPSADLTPEQAEEWKQSLASVDTGISSAIGIAEETGSMLLTPSQPDHRAVSLLPVHHVAILRSEQVVPDIVSLMKLWQEKGDVGGNAVFVTGPSRTADIEKELVLGIHGPQTVDVILMV